MVDAQQLSEISERVLRHFGDACFDSTPDAAAPLTLLDYVVIIPLGNQGTALIISATSAAAEQLAARMFDKPVSDLMRMDWIDALSELGNMVAGKLEDFLGTARSLGTPRYLAAGEIAMLWHSTTTQVEVGGVFVTQPVYIAVITDR